MIKLWQFEGAPKLDELITRYPPIRPRNVTAERNEIEALLDNAKPNLRLWLLLCSDLGIRSGTSNKISGKDYDREHGMLRFITKGNVHQTLPVTNEIKTILEPLDHHSSVPYVWQLRHKEHPKKETATKYSVEQLRTEMKKLRLSLGITKRFTPHDLRRTTAVALYKETKNIMAVKALLGHKDLKTTFWYLDHDMEEVDLSILERLKKPFIIAGKEKKA